MSEDKKPSSKAKFNKGEASPLSPAKSRSNADTSDNVTSGGVVLHSKLVYAASTLGVPSTKREKSEITQTSSLDGQKVGSPRSSVDRGAGTPISSFVRSIPTIRAFQGKHRQSGLFSKDDLSADISVSPSEICLTAQITDASKDRSGSIVGGTPTSGGDGGKQYPLSLVVSSVGSIRSGVFLENHRKQIYKPFRRKWRRFSRKYKGCIFALLSSITSSLASHFVRELSENKMYTPSYCLLWRYFGIFIPGIFIILYYRFFQSEMVFDTVWPLKGKEPIKKFCLTISRALVDVAASFLNYKAFEYLLQSETSTILNSKPIIVQLLAHYTLGEPWGVVPIIMSVVAAIGVVIMARPPFLLSKNDSDSDSSDFIDKRLPGVLCSGGSMLLASVIYCILRYLKDVHYSVFSISIGSVGLIFGIGLTFGLDQFVLPQNWQDWSCFTAVAVLVGISSIAIVIALQNEEAFVVSLVRSCDVIFSFIWEISLTNKYPDAYRGGGAAIIMFCVMIIFLRKYLTHQPTESKVYQMFSFLTK